DANGVRLHYLDWGGDRPPLLFLHPTGFHAHVWEPYAEHLAARFRCLALDTRGHGDSDKPGVYGWTDFADDLEAALDHLGLASVVGIGHSAGATSIAVVAARRPDLFARVVLLDPILFLGEPTPSNRTDNALFAAARRRRMRFASREAMLENYAAKPPFAAWDRRLLELYVNHGVRDLPDGDVDGVDRVELKCSGEDEAEMYRWGPRPLPSEEFLPRVACPALLISGEFSNALPPSRAAQAAALMPNCQALTLPTSHFVPFERPAETMAAIDRFLGGR
ncbi:MAG: alpha/beta fold hydrolase, partial [Dehalococcoidia bacterium]